MPSDDNDSWLNWPNLIFAIIAVIVGITAGRYAYLALLPNRKILLHEMISRARLLSNNESLHDIAVFYRNILLSDPWITQYVLSSNGWHSIRTEDFDQGRPIRINLNAKIIAVLHAPETLRWCIDESTLVIKKDLLPRKRVYKFALLCDGIPHDASIVHNLADVKVQTFVSYNHEKMKITSYYLPLALAPIFLVGSLLMLFNVISLEVLQIALLPAILSITIAGYRFRVIQKSPVYRVLFEHDFRSN